MSLWLSTPQQLFLSAGVAVEAAHPPTLVPCWCPGVSCCFLCVAAAAVADAAAACCHAVLLLLPCVAGVPPWVVAAASQWTPCAAQMKQQQQHPGLRISATWWQPQGRVHPSGRGEGFDQGGDRWWQQRHDRAGCRKWQQDMSAAFIGGCSAACEDGPSRTLIQSVSNLRIFPINNCLCPGPHTLHLAHLDMYAPLLLLICTAPHTPSATASFQMMTWTPGVMQDVLLLAGACECAVQSSAVHTAQPAAEAQRGACHTSACAAHCAHAGVPGAPGGWVVCEKGEGVGGCAWGAVEGVLQLPKALPGGLQSVRTWWLMMTCQTPSLVDALPQPQAQPPLWSPALPSHNPLSPLTTPTPTRTLPILLLLAQKQLRTAVHSYARLCTAMQLPTV